MADNRQLVEYGRELAPWLPEAAQNALANFVVDYAVRNPGEVVRMGRNLQQWVVQNFPEYRNRALQMGESIANRIAEDWRDAGEDLQNFVEMNHLERARVLAGRRPEVSPDENGNLPSLEDLIPDEADQLIEETDRVIQENAMENASGTRGTTRPPTGPPNGEPEAQRLATNAGMGNPVSKETPISPYPTLTFGLQETHTTILPWTGYFSVIGNDLSTPNVQEIRMTQPHDILTVQPANPPTGATAAWTKGIYNKKFNDSSKATDGGGVSTTASFPSTAPPGPYAGEKAAWFTYWAKLYEYYTVLGCEYEIHVTNPNTTNGTGVTMAWDYNAHNDTAGASGNKTPQDQPYHTMQQYKNINWVNVNDSAINNQSNGCGGKSYQILKGRYKPGMAKRNINNDGDVKTWIATGAPTAASPSAPTLKEFLTLYFYANPWNHLPQTVGTNNTNGVNVMVTVKYIVQFKDLYISARYPNSVTTNIVQTIEDDVISVA